MPLESYARERDRIRAELMAHKRNRRVQVGENITLIFEDERTIRYQVQEMIRAERLFEEYAINEELDAYNPLVPDGSNFKATMLIEYPDPVERAMQLTRLIGIEDSVILLAAGESVRAIADEDLERENDVKTSAVHFLRFELPYATVSALKAGGPLQISIDHPHYMHRVEIPDQIRIALLMDLS
jgi:glycerol-3-phosphate dehydrogenase subunit C